MIKCQAQCLKLIYLKIDTNELFSRNPFLNPSSFDQNLQVDYARNEVFEGGEILEIGGGYSNHYAIVKN